MTYVVNESCIRCKTMDCVEVCPVDCFYEGENMLVIHPDECIDCGVCKPECPVDAIKVAADNSKVRTAMSDNAIEVQNLTKRYGQTTVVRGISFSGGRGEIFGLLGPNGSGKTTTILMLLGLTEISDGQVRLLGHDPVREPLAVKRQAGYLPDSVGFYNNLSAADNL